MSLGSIWKLLFLAFFFVLGYFVWGFASFAMVEFGSDYKQLASYILGTALLALWLAFARWYLKRK